MQYLEKIKMEGVKGKQKNHRIGGKRECLEMNYPI